MPACRWGCDKHISQSNGADSNVMKFYCTTSATTYGQHWDKFQPRKGVHKGTGYLSNFRPQVYYNSHLDDFDNPRLKPILADNYTTITKQDYVGYGRSAGTEPFLRTVKQNETGFIREKALTIPTVNEVGSVYLDRHAVAAPIGVRPKGAPVLHQSYAKDPTEAENYGYGPEYMSTETHSKFRKNPKNSYQGLNPKKKQETGFTQAYNDEPLTYYPGQPHDGSLPDYMTNRPTGISISKSIYAPLEYGAQKQKLPRITDKANRDTGFVTAGDKLSVPSKEKPVGISVTGTDFPPKPLQPGYDNNQIGNKEDTGFTENVPRFVQTSDNPLRFITHYQTRFLDRTPPQTEGQGHVWGGVLPQKPDGYTKSTAVHSLAEVDSYPEGLKRLDPYVARSIIARDQFYDDHKYDSKTHTSYRKVVSAT